MLQRLGEPCHINNGNGDCEDGLVCLPASDSPYSWTGICSAIGKNDPWYVDWERHQCVQDCDERLGGNCGGVVSDKVQNFDELFVTHDMCCSLMLSWKSKNDCIPDYEALKDMPDVPNPPHENTELCASQGKTCYNRAEQFQCCSGICYDHMCK